MAWRRNLPNLKRKIASREPKRRFILVCEGSKTERDYFNALGAEYCDAIIKIEFIGGVGEPSAVAKRAIDEIKERGLQQKGNEISRLDSFEDNDEVWAVFDRDKRKHYDEPIKQCEKEQVQVARSNPCFELWMILHIEDYDKACDHKSIQKDLSKVCKEYNTRSKTADCAKLVVDVKTAERRALKLLKNRRNENTPFGPPSTTVGRLTARIRAASKKSKN